jgi:hypothetical protein
VLGFNANDVELVFCEVAPSTVIVRSGPVYGVAVNSGVDSRGNRRAKLLGEMSK